MAAPSVPSEDPVTMKIDKKRNKAAKLAKAGKLLNPMNKPAMVKGKAAMKLEIQVKKAKAVASRKKSQARVVTTIELDDSDESDCIPIELPPPPLITLDSSDEETIKKKRAMSPSTSSIISDDFIVAGDKRRLVNPFTDESENPQEKVRKVAQRKETLEKVKALTKVPSSTSSSDSARSSCERSGKTDEQVSTVAETRQKRKSSNSVDEDSIYGAKTRQTGKQAKNDDNESSEEETICVNAKTPTLHRRKSVSSRKKSSDGDSEVEEDPKMRLIANGPKKRSRFITPSYNDDEFATMISSIISTGDLVDEDDEENSDEREEVESKAPVINAIGDATEEPEEKTTEEPEDDCKIIEKPIVVIEVPDDEEQILSDSDDSMRDFSGPVECDLSLNITQTPYDPHEYIKNAVAGSSQELVKSDDTAVNPEVGWNEEMKFYYDGSWGDENFSISDILNAMPHDPKLWRVNNNDRIRTPETGSKLRCRKCNEVGHIAIRCNKPRKRIICFMCGEEGHRETRCPNSICLRVSQMIF